MIVFEDVLSSRPYVKRKGRGIRRTCIEKDEKTAKYVNSPKARFIIKQRALRHLFRQASNHETGSLFLGGRIYGRDRYAPSGRRNVVASSGTALTQGQIRLIHRFTNNITVLYDGDAAGIKAALRGIDMLLEEGMNVKVVLLPAGKIRTRLPVAISAKASSQSLSARTETDFIRFKTKLLLAEAGVIRSNVPP